MCLVRCLHKQFHYSYLENTINPISTCPRFASHDRETEIPPSLLIILENSLIPLPTEEKKLDGVYCPRYKGTGLKREEMIELPFILWWVLCARQLSHSDAICILSYFVRRIFLTQNKMIQNQGCSKGLPALSESLPDSLFHSSYLSKNRILLSIKLRNLCRCVDNWFIMVKGEEELFITRIFMNLKSC